MNTPFLDAAYKRIHFDRELVFKFFTAFSLFEYALKQSEYIKTIPYVQADWSTFAKTIQAKFDPNSSLVLKEAVNYFLEHPPQQQVVKYGHLFFEPSAPKPTFCDTEKLSIYIRCVRNNLFHGGKIGYEYPRDTELIQHALVILEEWAHLDGNVQDAFLYAM